ncbi:MAG: type 1 glutamine amidotransferase [Rhodospirillales bacterium]
MDNNLRILVIEGNTSDGNAAMAAAGLGSNAAQYADAVHLSAPDAEVTFAYPADRTDALPVGVSLADFDGVILGGSGLHVRGQENAPEVQRQVDLVRAVFDAGRPLLGSCWGLQVAVIAAGGDVGPSPNGREVGICRDITLNSTGAEFPMFMGKPRVFNSLAIHYDEVTKLPSGARVLAANGHSPVQAAAFEVGTGVFWGVQYHPEFTLPHMALLIRRYGPDMVEQGIFSDHTAMERETDAMLHMDGALTSYLNPDGGEFITLAAKLGIDHMITDPANRCREIDNWLQFCGSEKRD